MQYQKTNYLKHHGILGQKWGVRNGPPYPLHPDHHSAAEKKAGWQKSVSGGTGDVQSKNKNSTNYTKSSKVHSAADDVDFNQTKYFIDSRIKSITNAGFNVKSDPTDIRADSAAVNPNYKENAISEKYKMNCTNCITAYALRRMGLDVEAKPLAQGRDIREMNLMFKSCLGPKHTKKVSFNPHSDTAKSVRDGLVKQCEELCGDDAGVGFIRVQGPYCGHVFSWEKMDDGRVIFVDAQSNDVDNKVIDNYFNYIAKGRYLAPDVMVTRLDDCTIDTKAVHNAVRDHKER